MKATNLAEIADSLKPIYGVKFGDTTRFRVRDVVSLEDYCVYCVFDYGPEGAVRLFKAMYLDNFCKEIRLRADEDNYVLLSSLEEVVGLSTLPYGDFQNAMSDAYREMCLVKSEVRL